MSGLSTEPKPKRKSKGPSPTARSLAYARKQGWLADVCERKVPYSFITKDLFGVFDLIVIRDDAIVGVQCTGATASGNHAPRVEKLRAWEGLTSWCAAGAHAEVWSWAKRGRGKRKLWTLRVERVDAHPRACGVCA